MSDGRAQGDLGDGARGWLDRRWAELSEQVAVAPTPWADWARRELVGDDVGEGLRRRLGWSARPAVGSGVDGLDRSREAARRVQLGQVFTPPALSLLVAAMAGAGEEDARRPDATVLDPACGAGSLLLAVAERRHSSGWSVARALGSVVGWDIDPAAAWACRATLVGWALGVADGEIPGPLRVEVRDALEVDAADYGCVVTNPPYLEVKRMAGAAPGLKDQLRARFPELGGAYDLYLAFLWAALRWVAPGGRVVGLVPNRVLQGRYARPLRSRLVGGEAVSLVALADLSRVSPRPFPGTSVYPVVLCMDRGPSSGVFRARRFDALEGASPPSSWPEVQLEGLRGIGGEHPLFVPFDTWSTLEPLSRGLPRLGEVARTVSTCSFHAPGLREQFVTRERPAELAFPYVGGESRTRRTEVSPFRLAWAGWWIRFDQEQLRVRHRNPLPDLAGTFLRPKVIFCQHALRMRAVVDPDGRWVTKDTYPVAWPTHPDWTLGKLAAVLQSTVFTALYNTYYQGVVVGGETYHYLPAFLRHVPVPRGDHPALTDVDEDVLALHEPGPLDWERWLRVDRAVADAYGVSERARQQLVEVHLRRVGAESPG